MGKSLALLFVGILIIWSLSLAGSEDNVSFNLTNLYQENTSGEAHPLGPDVGICQSYYCDLKNYESNEGPGGIYCCANKGGSSGYEECTKYISKSTVYVYWLSGELKDKQTDYCKDSSILVEYYMDCNFWEDAILSIEKNCNDYDLYGDFEYYCTSTEVRKHRRFYNVGCLDGACTSISNNYVDDTLVSKKGDDNYCSERKSRGCSLCAHGDYDCDFDSECSSSLYCFGPMGGASDGCCYSEETWDTSRHECCECTSGACCDGCHYRISNYVCDPHVSGSDQYKCSSNCLDEDVLKRYQKQYCSGSSSSCTGSKEWVQYNYEDCVFPKYCSGSTIWGTTIPVCKTAQCTSGVCCDTTCGVYNYKSSSTKCLESTEYGCPWGNNLGNDVGKRAVTQYCSGSSDSCSGQVQYGGWTVSQDCSSTQYCENAQCKSIACSSDLDCPTDYWSWLECKNNDVWGMFVDRTCINPGTKESYCNLTEIYKKKEDCGDSGYVGDPYCWDYNMQPSVFQDYATRWCEDNSCKENIERQLIKICQTGCTNGVCNEDVCQDECSLGLTKCNGNVKQICGNYDSDSCLEWPSSTSGTGNENCGKTKYCSSNICNSCFSGTANCNENPSDSCEINLSNDNNNCGSCGNVCGTGKSCQNGNCTQKLQGDVNGDCKVNIFDLAKVGLCYSCSQGQSCWLSCSIADLSGNGKIDIFDLATVGLNYGKSC